MAGAHGGCGETTPLRIEPHFGKVAEYAVESASRNEPWDILKANEPCAGLANDFGDGGPNPSLIVKSRSLSGRAPRLAREASSDRIHRSAPGGCVELFKIAAPNRRWLQGLVFHPRQENGRSKGFPLDVAHSAASEGQFDGKVEHSGPGAESEIVDGISHMLTHSGKGMRACQTRRIRLR